MNIWFSIGTPEPGGPVQGCTDGAGEAGGAGEVGRGWAGPAMALAIKRQSLRLARSWPFEGGFFPELSPCSLGSTPLPENLAR